MHQISRISKIYKVFDHKEGYEVHHDKYNVLWVFCNIKHWNGIGDKSHSLSCAKWAKGNSINTQQPLSPL